MSYGEMPAATHRLHGVMHGQVELDRVAAQLSRRPRETLGWRNPAEKMAKLLLR